MKWDTQRLIARYRAQGSARVRNDMRGAVHYDHMLSYTAAFKRPSEMVQGKEQTRLTALWLTSYLAHWGMFRGSSQLQKTNILFFDHLANALLSGRSGLLIPFFHVGLCDLEDFDRGEIAKVLASVNDLLRGSGVSPTVTLVSKLILGCTGTVPGYDRYLQEGLKRLHARGLYEGSRQFSEAGLKALSRWYNEETWPVERCAVDNKVAIPAARLADMALTVYGSAP
jgi:hypothetical protein